MIAVMFALPNIFILIHHLTKSVLAIRLSTHPSLLLPPQNLTSTVSSNATTLHAPPPPGFHIDGPSDRVLPLPYSITFSHYGSSIAHPENAHACLNQAAAVMFLMHEPVLMGIKERLYVHEDVILGLEPGPGLTWGYWGAAIRAIITMWAEWDVIQLEFAIVVERDGVLGRGYLASLPASGRDRRGRRRGGVLEGG